MIFRSRSLSQSGEDLNADKMSHKVRGLWRRFDSNFMKPFFIEDWPHVKDDHDDISAKIINVFDEHQRKKIKNKELKDMSAGTVTAQDKIESLLDLNNPKKRKNSKTEIKK